ncbi:MAG: sigma-54-dependent Fis family transcriptional regulator [Planctomycetaceae bacterium]|nr:sigma-54-dependent Fis family transcriptional regulator [Planctomycetaceae bacterium]
MPKGLTVIAIDDDRSVLMLVERALADDGYEVIAVESAAKGLSAIESSRPAVVLLDIMLQDMTGLELFSSIRALDAKLPVVFITAAADSETAIEAIQLGGFDYIPKPLDLVHLRSVVTKAIKTRRLMSVPVALGSEPLKLENGDQLAFIGRSPAILEVFKAIGRVAQQDVPVLIRGESGTGKELVARAIYQHSQREEQCFMEVNCAALPDSLLESELFGHEKGAFTGADQRRIGKFEQCNGGTIFLDEVGDMAPVVQAKVLRLLQEQRFERVGGNETIETNVRIISATNQPLETMVEKGTFRADLIYRLNGVTIDLPPLRDRKNDIRLLSQHFLAQAVRDLNKPDIEGLAPETLEILLQHSWPGNVRELRAVIRQAVLNTTGPVIVPDFLPSELRGEAKPTARQRHEPADASPASGLVCSDLAKVVESALDEGKTDLYAITLEVMERYLLTRVLQETGGNQSKAAEILGITRGKIRDRIATFGISLDTNVAIESDTEL